MDQLSGPSLTSTLQESAQMWKDFSASLSTPSAPGGGSSLKSFDANNNNVLEDSEFFAAIDSWIASQIDDTTFFKAIDLWISGGAISAAQLSLKTLSLDSITLMSNPMRHAITFVAHGQGIIYMDVEIFNLNGQRVFSQEAAGSRLAWNLRASNGQHVANGVYLYTISVRGFDGAVIRTEVKKLVVLR